jgi:hypothetical protein
MKIRNSPVVYFLLSLWIVISMSYYVLGTIALREEFFNSSHYAEEPFQFEDDLQTVHDLSDAHKKLGLENGSVLRSINGEPYSGWRQLSRIVRNSKPGDLIEVGMISPHGLEKQFKVLLSSRQSPDWSPVGYIAYLVPILGVPLLGLLVGYWVVAGRGRVISTPGWSCCSSLSPRPLSATSTGASGPVGHIRYSAFGTS